MHKEKKRVKDITIIDSKNKLNDHTSRLNKSHEQNIYNVMNIRTVINNDIKPNDVKKP